MLRMRMALYNILKEAKAIDRKPIVRIGLCVAALES
jgi:hypothetical protein